MSSFFSHAFFFLALCLAIVVMSAFYADPADGTALRSIPRRYVVFVGSCTVIALGMLAIAHLFVRVS